jgi:hypothetical protein
LEVLPPERNVFSGLPTVAVAAAWDLLVIDDVGLGQLKRRDEEATAAHLLFTLLDRLAASG